jgi:hypothetical protein
MLVVEQNMRFSYIVLKVVGCVLGEVSAGAWWAVPIDSVESGV